MFPRCCHPSKDALRISLCLQCTPIGSARYQCLSSPFTLIHRQQNINISSSIINHRLYFTHKSLLKLLRLDCFFTSGSTEHVNLLLGGRFQKRWHSSYVSSSRMGPDRNGRPRGNTKCLLQMCFYIHISGLLSLAASYL